MIEAFRRSYALKIAIAIAAVVAVVAIVGVATVTVTEARLEQNVRDSMTTQANAEASTVERWLQGNREFARLASSNPALDTDSQPEIDASLRASYGARSDEAIVAMHIVDRVNNSVVASVGADTAPADAPFRQDRLFFQSYGDVVVTEPYRVGNRTVIAFASPIEGSTTDTLVVVAATSGLTEQFEDTYGGGFTTVVDSGGTVVIGDTPAGDDRYADPGETPVAVRQGLQGQSGFQGEFTYESRLDGDYVQAYAPVSRTDWVVVKHARADAAFRVAEGVRLGVAGFVVVVLVAAVGAFGIVELGTIRTLRDLSARARAVADGDYETDIAVDREDEFGDLGHSIEDMRDELVARIGAAERSERRLSTVVENLPAALVAFDANGRITTVEGRDTASVVGDDAVGERAQDRLADGAAAAECDRALDGAKTATTVELPDGIYDLRFSPTDDGAVIVVAHDVTAQQTARQRLEVLNRVLRHDVRNRLNVVIGRAEGLRARAEEPPDRRAAEVIRAEAEAIVALSEDARAAQTVIDSEVATVNVSRAVAGAVEAARERHDRLAVTTDVTPDCVATANAAVGQAVEELLSMALDRVPEDGSVQATVTVEPDGDAVVVTVEDDGTPIPTEERRSLERGAESQLEHVSGLGLWLVYWTVSLGGGTLEIADSDEGGARVTCRFQRVSSARSIPGED